MEIWERKRASPPAGRSGGATAADAAVPRRPGPRWLGIAGVALTLAAAINMWGWVGSDAVPLGDHAGYIAAIEHVGSTLERYGRLPRWIPDQLGGTSRFTSAFKELVALPFLLWRGPTSGYALALAVSKILAALALCGLVATLFRSRAAGLLAGYAYGFGAIANHGTAFDGHLDIALSYLLLPLVLISAMQSLRGRGRSWALLLGALIALQIHTHYLPVAACLLTVLLLWALRPWRDAPQGGPGAPTPPSPLRAIGILGVAFTAFALLAASQLAWLALDSGHHALRDPALAAQARERFSVQSPFLLLNRVDWLGAWLVSHRPETLELHPGWPIYEQRLYLGGVALAVIAAAGALRRRIPLARRWYTFFGLLFAIQYWLAMGPYPLLWQLARSFHWPEVVEQWVARALLAGAALIILRVALLALRRRDDRRPRRWLWIAAGLVAVSTSLFDILEALLPPLRVVRAPGHFFDLAPFAFYGWFGVSFAAIAHELRHRPRLQRAGVAVVALALVFDFAPSRAAYDRLAPLQPLREFAAVLAQLEPGSPPARLGASLYATPSNLTFSSLVAGASELGLARSWVAWQATPYWDAYYRHVHASLTGAQRSAEPGGALARVGRIRYYLDEFREGRRARLVPPWRRVAENARFVLWEQPEVLPHAFAARDYLLSVQTTPREDLALAEQLAPLGVVVLSVPDPQSPEFDALADGAAFLHGPPSARAALQSAIRHKLVTPGELGRRVGGDSRPRLEVRYERPAPERIALELDAGAERAVVFVSESYHPWWRARVDGDPAPVLRAMGAFMAVGVAPGAHRIDLRFRRPAPVWIADVVSPALWIALLGGLLVGATRRSRARRRAQSCPHAQD